MNIKSNFIFLTIIALSFYAQNANAKTINCVLFDQYGNYAAVYSKDGTICTCKDKEIQTKLIPQLNKFQEQATADGEHDAASDLRKLVSKVKNCSASKNIDRLEGKYAHIEVHGDATNDLKAYKSGNYKDLIAVKLISRD